MGELDGKVAIVTGSSRGLGKAMALTFARAGARVVVAARTEEPHPRIRGTIVQTAEEIRAAGGTALAVRCNVASDQDVEAMVQQTLAEFGRVDILVHNAAANFPGGVAEIDLRRWDILMGVNVRALYALVRGVLPSMQAQGSGHIVSVSPRAEGFSLGGPYTQSKAALTRLTLSIAQELKAQGIAANCLWPDGTRRTEGTMLMRGGTLPPEAMSPQLFADAALAVVTKDPHTYTGRTLLDTEVLREEGITDFSQYAGSAEVS